MPRSGESGFDFILIKKLDINDSLFIEGHNKSEFIENVQDLHKSREAAIQYSRWSVIFFYKELCSQTDTHILKSS